MIISKFLLDLLYTFSIIELKNHLIIIKFKIRFFFRLF